MKKLFIFFAMVLTLAGITSCSDKEDDMPKFIVGFAQNAYTVDNSVGAVTTVRLVSSSPAETNLTVPFTLTGEGAGELTVSAQQFEFKAGESAAEITVTRKAVSKSRSATMTLANTDGVRLGLMDYTQVVLIGPNVYSFADSHDKLAIVKSFDITLETATGSKFSFPDTTALDVDVDAASTAVEGTDFEFVNGKKAIFPAGKNKGQVTIKFLKKREGHDKIVLGLNKSESMIPGNNPTLTISIMGDADLSGTWVFSSVINNTWWEQSWGIAATILVDGTPEGDEFTLKGDGKNYQFTPNFTGKLKNYFTAAGTATNIGTRIEWLQEEGGFPPKKTDLTVLKIDNINLNISPVDKTIGSYRVGFFMRSSEKTNQEMLIMTIYEYKPTDTTIGESGTSWKELYESMAYSGSDPAMLDAPIRIAFTRKE
ncbi:hypothetical protein [Hallella bergensis]|uniref:hypothetical protein n=1 Tax=Hallella bergensis TaxID=242750 RepID=UPI003990A314